MELTRQEFETILDKKLEPFAKKSDFKEFVTKNDFKELTKEFAKKKDLNAFATKDDLKKLTAKFATKKDLEPFATKKDLETLPTKIDLEKGLGDLRISILSNIPFNSDIEKIKSDLSEIKEKLNQHDNYFDCLMTEKKNRDEAKDISKEETRQIQIWAIKVGEKIDVKFEP